MFSGAPGTMAGTGVLLYLLYIIYLDLGQVQVESSPVEASCATSALSPAMKSLLPLQQGRFTPLSLLLPLISLA
jgi:hypothetical protein